MFMMANDLAVTDGPFAQREKRNSGVREVHAPEHVAMFAMDALRQLTVRSLQRTHGFRVCVPRRVVTRLADAVLVSCESEAGGAILFVRSDFSRRRSSPITTSRSLFEAGRTVSWNDLVGVDSVRTQAADRRIHDYS